MATLNEYLKQFLKNERIEDYASYLARMGELSMESSLAIGGIDAESAKSTSRYGRAADRIADVGLSDSGYADYLSAEAYAQGQAARDEIARSDRESYLAYLESKRKERELLRAQEEKQKQDALLAEAERQSREAAQAQAQAEKEKKERESARIGAIEKIRSAAILDVEAAYRYAVALGLNEEDARAAATAATDVYEHSQSRINEIVSYCVINNVYPRQGYAYAISLGYGEELARRIEEMLTKYRELRYED